LRVVIPGRERSERTRNPYSAAVPRRRALA
jgi:hypothetical protein